jgi:small subunit ribosomal protein S21
MSVPQIKSVLGCETSVQKAIQGPTCMDEIKKQRLFCPHEYVCWPCCTNSSMITKAVWQVRRWIYLAEVRVQEGEPLENALRRFKRKVQQEDIIKEVKRHSYYLKPGEKKRVKAALARKRNRKKARKEQD